MRLMALSVISTEYITHSKVLRPFVFLLLAFLLDPENTKLKKRNHVHTYSLDNTFVFSSFYLTIIVTCAYIHIYA